ncbi:hypothetical protein FIU87_19135 [Bacillus sp. THAF10]|uniref:hypothetical protein n=1 Tax=Bacillus sp. THAF10 TaxID=2587848 RepID=UPI001267E7EC|nr:hypothetical protein [Bacillus sp. THAF10]QFT90763.1 hypothetical protein FIU87_19135 [Bacillus sp. THAF10]
MKEYGLFFVGFFLIAYVVLIVMGLGETITSIGELFILSLIMVIVKWMGDSFFAASKSKSK